MKKMRINRKVDDAMKSTGLAMQRPVGLESQSAGLNPSITRSVVHDMKIVPTGLVRKKSCKNNDVTTVPNADRHPLLQPSFTQYATSPFA
jgi:hypothetical protein